MTQILRDRYPSESTSVLAKYLEVPQKRVHSKAARLGIKKTEEFLASSESGRTDGSRGGATRFKAGHVTWNKGVKGICYEGGKATQFKKGMKPRNHLPVGHIRLNSEGYYDIKTAEGKNKFVPLHRWNWFQKHGEYPPKNMTLCFKDGNPKNCELDNLELISRADLMMRNTVHNLPKEIAELVQLRGAVNRQINKRKQNV